LVSTIATTGMCSFTASSTASFSRQTSTTKTAEGRPFMLFTPPRLFCSLASSWRSAETSFFGSFSISPLFSIASIRSMRATLWRTVRLLVSMPPSQRLTT
jgi:hypothetical protein